MKKNVLILVVILASFSLNSFAQSVVTTVTKAPLQQKEHIINDKKTQEPKLKKVFLSDQSGKRMEMHVYQWDRKSEDWVLSAKTEYKYNANDQLTQMVNMEWDRASLQWYNKKVQDVIPG